MRAISPSVFMISQSTAPGTGPPPREVDARLGLAGAHEHAVARARSGNMWPGITRSSARVFGSMSTCTVRARSAAEMPVVTPVRASTETVNGVPKCGACSPLVHHHRKLQLFEALFGHRQQISPRPYFAMKLMASGVTNCAAMHEVAFVLAVLVVDDDDEAPAAVLLDRLGHRRHHRVAFSHDRASLLSLTKFST